jgi:pyruvate/2-oxoglutarate dehydrogenase complex dihydrolipoamide acyltransferase (E2) component
VALADQAGARSSPRLWRAASPSAGIDLAPISGSGPHGSRHQEADVEAAIAGGTGKATAESAAPAPQPHRRPAKGNVDEAVLKNVRGRVLRVGQARWHAQDDCAPPEESKQTIPHFYVTGGLRIGCAAQVAQRS